MNQRTVVPEAIQSVLAQTGLGPVSPAEAVEPHPGGTQLLWIGLPAQSPCLQLLRANATVPVAPIVIDPRAGHCARRMAVSLLEWLNPERLRDRLVNGSACSGGDPTAPESVELEPRSEQVGRSGRLEILDGAGGPYLSARVFPNRLLQAGGAPAATATDAAITAAVKLLLQRAGGTRDQFHLLRSERGIADVERAVPIAGDDERAVRKKARRLLVEAEDDRTLVDLWLNEDAPELVLSGAGSEQDCAMNISQEGA